MAGRALTLLLHLHLSPHLPTLNAAAMTIVNVAIVDKTVQFVGRNQALELAGRYLHQPLTYFASQSKPLNDPSIIWTGLPIGDAALASQDQQWTGYASSDANLRALYLDWLAGGRNAPTIPPAFLFSYLAGLEDRTLRDKKDELACVEEIRRLNAIYPRNPWLHQHGAPLQSYLGFRFLRTMSYQDLRWWYDPLIAIAPSASTAVLTWHFEKKVALQADLARALTAKFRGTAQGIVLERSRAEFDELFARRYRDRFGEGLLLRAAARRLYLSYFATSAHFFESNHWAGFPSADVLAIPEQFEPLIAIWNSCITDLRPLSRQRIERRDQPLSLATWSTLPPELREFIAPPGIHQWQESIARAQHSRGVHLTTAGTLAALVGITARTKLTPIDLTKVAQCAKVLGYLIEPDPLLTGRKLSWTAPIAIWRGECTSEVDREKYSGARKLAALLLLVATAGGAPDEATLDKISELVAKSFALDPALRKRIQAWRELALRTSPRHDQVAVEFIETASFQDHPRTAAMLVEVAAAKGFVLAKERRMLLLLYGFLGLGGIDLDNALLQSKAKLACDDLIESGSADLRITGEALPKSSPMPCEQAPLDFARIAQLQQETREITEILSAILENEAIQSPKGLTEIAALKSSPSAKKPKNLGLHALDRQYRDILAKLVEKPAWPMPEIHALAKAHHLMPIGIAETLNCWSEDEFDDSLIEEGESWIINASIVERLHA
jgi:hypothetical protein